MRAYSSNNSNSNNNNNNNNNNDNNNNNNKNNNSQKLSGYLRCTMELPNDKELGHYGQFIMIFHNFKSARCSGQKKPK